MEEWTDQLSRALDHGFILTIDYGQLATDLYSPQNARGTLVCYNRHVVSSDPYQHIGQQDITCQVDFTSLMRMGDRHGLTTVGYALQSQFLTNLGFFSFLDALQNARPIRSPNGTEPYGHDDPGGLERVWRLQSACPS